MISVEYNSIGIIRSEHILQEKTPIQPVFACGCIGHIEIFPQYVEGLKDLDGFSHIILLYHFHKVTKKSLIVKPFMDNVERGVFATRHCGRPNSIGISIVKLKKIENNIIYIEDVDILDETPLLDIKPYVARFDFIENPKSGWTELVDDKTATLRGKRGYDGKKS